MKKLSLAFAIPIISFLFFWQVFVNGFLPIPSDTIVGLYYPFRDIYSKTNPNGVPFKNFLITDPVRQQYPWRELAVTVLKNGELPTWNPYNFAGTPMLSNFQSGTFYPLNVFFFLLPFSFAWTLLIISQPILAGIFMFIFLRNLKLSSLPSLLGSLAFSFSGFSVSWLEWGTIVHTALWLPLILLIIDKIFALLRKDILISWWAILLVFSFSSSFFAGHLQTFFYILVFSLLYFLARLVQYGRILRNTGVFVLLCISVVFATFIQWFPTLRFILASARGIDTFGFENAGWFIPWENIVQFVVPDYFGNPTTLNYWGEWNYGEFIGYVGVIPLIASLIALFSRKDKKTFFFGAVFFASAIMSFPTLFARLPFELKIPFISTAQPTRLIFLIDFSLSVLAALGLDYFIKFKKTNLLYVITFLSITFIGLWIFTLTASGSNAFIEQLKVSRQNLILPTVFLIASAALMLFVLFLSKIKSLSKLIKYTLPLLILLTIIDLFRFGWKFTPFTKQEYLFPKTSVTTFLEKQKKEEPFRVMSLDSRILPPNFSIAYQIEMLEGYDPLYLQRYGELMAALGRGKADISAPFGFNRIITSQNYSSHLINLLNVKYLLSLTQIDDKKLKQVYGNGNIYIYENIQVVPRAFLTTNVILSNSKQETMDILFENDSKKEIAVIEGAKGKVFANTSWSLGEVKFLEYKPNNVILESQSEGESFLVLSDSYYSTWRAKIDDRDAEIYLTNYNFRGIVVPKGVHRIEFYNTLF